MTQTRPDHFKIPHNSRFLDQEFKLKVTPESKSLFAAGAPGQGYIGLVDVETGDIHLVPSFNKDDGLVRLNKEGKEFVIEREGKEVKLSMASQFELGTMGTGDLHRNCSAMLGLADKGAQNGKLIGFGIWKGGVAIKVVPDMPQETALVPKEYLFFKKEGKWKAVYVNDEYDYASSEKKEMLREMGVYDSGNDRSEILKREAVFCLQREEVPIDSVPGLEALLESKSINTVEGRKAVADLLGKYRGTGRVIPVKFIKNRSTQNTFSCKYTELFRAFFQIVTSSHGAHQLGLPRECPSAAFKKIVQSMYAGLELKFNDADEFELFEPLSADSTNGIAYHFCLEKRWVENRDECLKEMCRMVLDDESTTSPDKELLIHFLKLADKEMIGKMRVEIKLFLYKHIFKNLELAKKAFDCLLVTVSSPEELAKELKDLNGFDNEFLWGTKLKTYLTALFAAWAGKPPNYNQWDSAGNTLLFITLIHDMNSLNLILKMGADPNHPNASGDIPILYAAQNKKWEQLAKLLEFKANPNVRGKKGSPLEMAWKEKEGSVVANLVSYGAHPFEEKEVSGSFAPAAPGAASEVKPQALFQFLFDEKRESAIVDLFKKSHPDIQVKICDSLAACLKSTTNQETTTQILKLICQLAILPENNHVVEQLVRMIEGSFDKLNDNPERMIAVFKVGEKNKTMEAAIGKWVEENSEVRRQIQSSIQLSAAYAAVTKTVSQAETSFLKQKLENSSTPVSSAVEFKKTKQ